MESNKKIRVCHLASGDLWAGAEVQICTLLSQLQKLPTLKMSAIILNEGELLKRLTGSGMDVHLINEKSNSFFQILKDAGKYLREKRIDLIHSHRYKENILAALLKKQGVSQYIVQTIHGEAEPFKGIDKIKSMISTSLNHYYTKKYFDRIVTVSEDIKNRANIVFDRKRLLAIHNSIDLHKVAPSRNAVDLRTELGIEINQLVIGTAGRLVPVKGYDIFLKAANLIREYSPETIFVLAGDGPLREELETKCSELNLSKNFRFLGFRHDIVNLINMFDLFVMSSHNEGIPIILLEAMSLSVPVVATNVGGIPEVVKDGQTGLLVKPGDPYALCKACLKMLENKELRKKLGEKGKERIVGEFEVAKQAENFFEVYRDLCIA